MGLSADYLGSAQEDWNVLAAATSGKLQCILTTPETLLNNQVRSMLMSKVYKDSLIAIIVDEAHCISKW
jgi:superfamily II DNA helicase RecQ